MAKENRSKGSRKTPPNEKYPVQMTTGVWLDPFTYQDSEGEWITPLGAEKTYSLLSESLYKQRSDRGCRYLDGKRIKHKYVSPASPRNRERILVFFKECIVTIADSRQEEPAEHEIDQGWLSGEELRREHNVSLMFCSYWRNRNSILRPGEKALRTKKAISPSAFGRLKITKYCKGDVQQILRGNESTHKGMGNRKQRKHAGEIDDREAWQIIKSILAQGPLPSGELLKQAQMKGVCRPAFYRVKANSPVKVQRGGNGRGRWYWYLPGQKPPISSREPNDTSAHSSLLVSTASKRAVPNEVDGPSTSSAMPWDSPADDSPYPGHTRKPYRTGRPADTSREKLLKFCYDHYISEGMKQSLVLTKAKTAFPNLEIMSSREVRDNAKEWAQRWVPPLPLNRKPPE